MKKYKFLPLLLGSLLLTANSPAPYPTVEEYSSFTMDVTYVQKTAFEGYIYSITLTNTGLYYMEYYTLYNDDYGVLGCTSHTLFSEELLAPGQSVTANYSYNLSTFPEDFNPETYFDQEIIWHSECYNYVESEVKISNPTLERIRDDYYRINGKISGLEDYYYGGIVDVEYEGKNYSFMTNVNDDGLTFYTNSSIEIDKVNIKNITFVRSSYQTYKGGHILVGVFIVFLLGMVVLPIILVTILVVVLIKRRKKKNVNANVDQKENSTTN